MSKTIELYHEPEMKGKLSHLQGESLIGLINRSADKVVWCIENLEWKLSDDAKEYLADKLKDKRKGYRSSTTYKPGKFY